MPQPLPGCCSWTGMLLIARYPAVFCDIAILLLALGVAFGLFWLDRRSPPICGSASPARPSWRPQVSTVVAYYTTWISELPAFLLQDAVLTPAIIGLWVLFWAYWFRMARMVLLHCTVWGLVMLLAIGMAMTRGRSTVVWFPSTPSSGSRRSLWLSSCCSGFCWFGLRCAAFAKTSPRAGLHCPPWCW